MRMIERSNVHGAQIWMDLLASCSKESIYSRFRYFFHWQFHEVAARYCYIDHDREIAIVTEITQDGRRLAQ
jgi:acetyltransferase